MKIYNKNSDKIEQPIVASIGFFDGVHKGHVCLIDQVIKEAKKRSLPSALITFKKHPREILDDGYQPLLLNSYEEKLELLSKSKIDICIPLDFTQDLAQMTAYEFMDEILVKQLCVNTLVIGYDHRFGHDRVDGFDEYVEYGKKLGMTVLLAEELEGEEYISSSRIRGLIEGGEIEKASELLGYNYTIEGQVVEGYKVGRTIGYPTANLKLLNELKVVPPHGVYATNVYLDGSRLEGMLYIGRRPTLYSKVERSIEVHIFDLSEELYGKILKVEIFKFMRKDVKFESLDILQRQLEEDERRVRKYLAERINKV